MSNLPSVGSLVSTQDTNKQLSSIRSYLNQLREELEAELMNIGYDNLSADLKKKLSSMSDDIMVAGEDSTATYEYVKANVLTASEISATYVSTNALTTQYLTAEYINTLGITASYISAECMQAISLDASQITSGVISADRVYSNALWTSYIKAKVVDLGYITAEGITASRINTALNQASLSISTTCMAASFKLQAYPGDNYEINKFYVLTEGSTQYYIPCHIVQN